MRNNFFDTDASALWQTKWISEGSEPTVLTSKASFDEYNQLEQTPELTVWCMYAHFSRVTIPLVKSFATE